MSKTKYIFITGGVVSSLGKGITAASLGRLLKARGYKVSIQKFDPYINVNPGNMSPYQHGEVFVTDDGGECDLDVGHYERFIDENLTVDSDITSGQIYLSVIEKERAGEFQGGTVQVIPHITNEIKRRIYRIAKAGAPDVIITEIGGTVGDIESLPFLEAIRQIRYDIGQENCAYIHVTLVPYLGKAGELKTKPTQHSVKELTGIGIQPDFIICRTDVSLPKPLRDKIGLFCNIAGEDVIQNVDADSLYEVPLLLEAEGLGSRVCKRLGMANGEADLAEWRAIVERGKHLDKKVKIALVGKYVELRDAYFSLTEALSHAGNALGAHIEIDWIPSSSLESCPDLDAILEGAHGIIVPGGFGERGAEGKVRAAGYARVKKIPFYGINMGMQMAVVEFARSVLGLQDANSTEHAPDTGNPIVDLLSEKKEMGDTMRRGKYRCTIEKGSRAFEAYGENEANERHRHRYEINEDYVPLLAQHGMVVTGRSEQGLVEIIEIPEHPWYVGVQFNAEFRSRPNKAHPLLVAFVQAALDNPKL